MMPYLIGFFIPLAGLAILIFLLSLLMQYSVYGNIGEQSGNAEAHDSATDEQEIDINQTGRDPIADAIHAYRRSRRTDEGERAQRERVTIVVLGVTAIFAFLAAAAASYSALIFLGQLGEMHQTSIDTAALVRTADDTEHRQLRAYIGPVFDSFRLTAEYAKCALNDTAIGPPHIIFCYHFKNYGLTPARAPHNCVVIYVGPVRGTLNETKNALLSKCAPNPLPTSPTIWPGESRLAEEKQFQKEMALIMAGSSGFLFGKLTYYDVFGDFHFTDTCRQITHDMTGIIFNPCRIEGQQDN